MDAKRENLRGLIEKDIPFLQKVAVRVEAMEPRRVRLRLAHDPANDNYVGTTHAGAIFTFGETCAGAAAGMSFALTRLRMLARHAEITYRKPVSGDLHAEVEILPEAASRVQGEIEREGKAILPVTVQMENDAGEAVAEMTVHYDFRGTR